ncbi:MAG: biotin/lipoyl-binding protein [Anaerolineales bacterium]|nr:biotin/lipoyl-binding protein [Anaerolineales bacterium]
MKYLTTVEGQTFEIEVNVEGELVVDGNSVVIDFRPVAGQPVYSLLVNGRSYEAYVNPVDDGLQVMLQGRLYQVTVEDERQKRLRESSAGLPVTKGEIQVNAPMPGLVVATVVEAGQPVEKGEILAILESMKMHNELKAARAGTITRVRVKAGDSVEQNQVLMTLE